MRQVICDGCGKSIEPDNYGFAPFGSGWLSVTKRAENYAAPNDYCSEACAIKALSTPAPASETTSTTSTNAPTTVQ